MRISVALLSGLALLGTSSRGEIYGTVRMGKQLLAGVPVTITSAAGTVADTTDKYGAYRLFVKETGKVTITVHYKDQSPMLAITSGADPVRYRLVLEEAGGKYTLHSE